MKKGDGIINKAPSIIIFTGFLGSGKTTFLLKKAKKFAQEKVKFAVIENEVGETGVDQLVFTKNGFPVREIFGGCICCSLTVNLKETVKVLVDDFLIDVILLEASGLANAKQIIDALLESGYQRESIHNIMILDALRIEMLQDVLGPLTKDAILAADEIIITKGDIASKGQLQMAKDLIASYRSEIIPAEESGNSLCR